MNSQIPFHRPRILLFAAVVLPALTGCWTPSPPTPQQLDRGLVILFPGIEGGPWQVEGPYRAFREAGVDSAIRAHNWKHLFGSLCNLIDIRRNRAMAAELAQEIAEYVRAYPRRPVDLVGYSGGGGLALFVAEALPDDVRLRNVVLVQAAVSPDYDLLAALRHMDGLVVNLYSERDRMIVGAGTELFGTMDRKRTKSAGHIGFDVEKAVSDALLRPRLVQRAWTRKDEALGHHGGHYDIVQPGWNRAVIAPYLLTDQSKTVPAEHARSANLRGGGFDR